jgi:hypothetical protein
MNKKPALRAHCNGHFEDDGTCTLIIKVEGIRTKEDSIIIGQAAGDALQAKMKEIYGGQFYEYIRDGIPMVRN